MVQGKVIDGIKYIRLYNDNNFKKLSLEDNVYFTLQDILLNTKSLYHFVEAYQFNNMLSGKIRYEDRDTSFTYVNILDKHNNLSKLINWLKYFEEDCFEFNSELDEPFDINKYIKFDDWRVNFVDLVNQLREKRSITRKVKKN